LLAAAAIAASPLLRDAEQPVLLLFIGGAALFALCVGLLGRWSAAVAVGVAVLGAQHALRLATGPETLDSWTPLYAGGLLLVAELAWWSNEPRVTSWSEGGVGLRRAGTVLSTCAGAAVVSALVVLAAGAPLRGGLALELVGVLAAMAALGVVACVARTR
jgi:hypothetical protein